MGCMAIRKSEGFTELWCDEPSDVLGDWLREMYGEYDLDNETKCKTIFYKVLNSKALFLKGYNKVKKNFHAQGEPKRDMTLFEYIYHLNFVLGSIVNIDKLKVPPYLEMDIKKQTGIPHITAVYRGNETAKFTFRQPGNKVTEKSPVIKKQKYNPYEGF